MSPDGGGMSHYDAGGITVHHGDCLDVLRELGDASVDAVVTDPPYNLSFMSKSWDTFAATRGATEVKCETCLQAIRDGRDLHQVWPDYEAHRLTHEIREPPVGGSPFHAWCQLWATECLRVLKPGGHLLAFGGTRTSHRLACAIEDAGFEIRDSLVWLYGSGFPKSLDVSKAIDRMAGVEREIIGSKRGQPGYSLTDGNGDHRTYGRGLGNTGSGEAECAVTAPATGDARRWAGWGTALKPAWENVVCARKPMPALSQIVVARKPLAGTVAQTVLAWGTGALNVDGCRIEHGGDIANANGGGQGAGYEAHNKPSRIYGKNLGGIVADPHAAGRWPANVVLSHSATCTDTACVDGCPVQELDAQSGERPAGRPQNRYGGGDKFGGAPYGEGLGERTGWDQSPSYTDTGGASRFFYTAKADANERIRVNGTAHPTVKPLALMRWLVRLVTPPGGLILDPFAGSGTTLEAALLEGFRCIGIEREAEYLPLIMQRLNRRRDPVAYVKADGGDGGLFDLLGEPG